MGLFSLGWIELIGEFFQGLVLASDLHCDLAFLGLQHDRLFTEAPDHVERTARRTPQRQFFHVRGNPALDDRTQLRHQRKEPIRRTQAGERLMRPPVVVELHPLTHALLRLLEAVELRAHQEVRPNGLPEPLNLAQRLRVMRAAAEVMDVILLQFLLKPRLAAPVGVLPAIVRQHLLGHAILRDSPPIHFQHVLRRLAAIQSQPDQVARVIVQEPNQVRILTAQANGANVALPHLIRRRPLKEPRLRWIPVRFAPHFLDEALLMQHPPDRLATHRQEQPPAQQLRDLLHAQGRLLVLQRGDLVAHRRSQPLALRSLGLNRLRRVPQPGLAVPPIAADPLRQRAGTNPEFTNDERLWKAFFQPELHGFQTQLKRIDGPSAATRKPPRGLGGGGLLF
jgi:hypothetical protein